MSLDESDGVAQACVLNVDNLSLIRPAFCTGLITCLDHARMGEVYTAIQRATACG